MVGQDGKRLPPGPALDALVADAFQKLGMLAFADCILQGHCSTEHDNALELLATLEGLLRAAGLYAGFTLLTIGSEILVHVQVRQRNLGPVRGEDLYHAIALAALKVLSDPIVRDLLLLTAAKQCT